MRRRGVAAFGVVLLGISVVRADDEGLARGGASYLNFAVGARSTAMGNAQAAVRAEDASALHANNAQLVHLRSQHITTTTGMLGLDRYLYFVGYALPLGRRAGEQEGKSLAVQLEEESDDDIFNRSLQAMEEHAMDSDGSAETTSERFFKSAFVNTAYQDHTLALGMTFFGVKGIEGRSEYGMREADFQDIERAISASYAFRLYENLSMGFTGKYLGQSLQSASADGFSFDVGTWYSVPGVRKGQWDWALAMKDLGGTLKWKVSDPFLNTEFKYSEPVLSKLVLGTAYATPSRHWLVALDMVKAEKQKARMHAGLEWRGLSHFTLRAGANAYDPTFGFGLDWQFQSLAFKLDYAFQYDLQSLASPHWLTLGMEFAVPRWQRKPKKEEDLSDLSREMRDMKSDSSPAINPKEFEQIRSQDVDFEMESLRE